MSGLQVENVRGRVSLAPNLIERLLAFGALVLLAVVLVALGKGYASWGRISSLVWLHLLTIVVSLALTPILLLQRRGGRRHRVLGYVWVAAMTLTAALSFGIRDSNHGGLSAIHILSAVTLTQAPMLAWHAHRHNVIAHRITVQWMVAGALLIAGFFTFPFGRMLGRWLLG